MGGFGGDTCLSSGMCVCIFVYVGVSAESVFVCVCMRMFIRLYHTEEGGGRFIPLFLYPLHYVFTVTTHFA